MAIVRYEMPDSGGTSSQDARETFGSFLANPIFTVARLLQPKPKQPFYFPVEVDTETGLVEVQIPADALKPRGRDRGVQMSRYQDANAARQHLETAFATGVVPKNTPSNYRDVAALIAQLEHDTPAPDPSAFDVFQREAEPVAEPDSQSDPYPELAMAGYIPPGGLAGFAQMAPASKAALTAGVRVGGGKRRRKRKAKATKRRARRASGGRRRKLVKGSAAAKRFMANLRKRRRK